MDHQAYEVRIAYWLDQHASEYGNWDDIAKNLAAFLESGDQVPMSWIVTGKV